MAATGVEDPLAALQQELIRLVAVGTSRDGVAAWLAKLLGDVGALAARWSLPRDDLHRGILALFDVFDGDAEAAWAGPALLGLIIFSCPLVSLSLIHI